MPTVRTASATVASLVAISAMVMAPLPPAAAKDQPMSPLVGALAECRSMTDDVARLACFDQASAALVDATQKGEVSVVDRQQMREARKSLFGFQVPKLPFFSGDKSAEDAPNEIESTITWARSIGHGKYQIRIADGNALWETTEASMKLRDPEKGQKILIKRGTLGAYLLRINGQRGVQGRRIG